jgi:uncharacterized protein YcbX
MARRIASLSYTALKGTALHWPTSVDVGPGGIDDDRLFHLVDTTDGRQVKTSPKLLRVRSRYDASTRELAVELPDGRHAEAVVTLGSPVTAKIGWDQDRPLESREVVGPWSELFSPYLGKPVVLTQGMRPEKAIDVEPITLVSHASIRRAERELDGQQLGAGRFRMNLNLDGLAEHEEDEWYGRRVAIGGTVLLITGPVPRCAVTTLNAQTGERDASTVKAIVGYRDAIPDPGSGEPVKAPFGVYARVERAGRIAVGDPVELLDQD